MGDKYISVGEEHRANQLRWAVILRPLIGSGYASVGTPEAVGCCSIGWRERERERRKAGCVHLAHGRYQPAGESDTASLQQPVPLSEIHGTGNRDWTLSGWAVSPLGLPHTPASQPPAAHALRFCRETAKSKRPRPYSLVHFLSTLVVSRALSLCVQTLCRLETPLPVKTCFFLLLFQSCGQHALLRSRRHSFAEQLSH